MSTMLRRIIAQRIAQATSRTEESILPLLTPVPTKKNSSDEFKVRFPISALQENEDVAQNGRRPDTSMLNDQAWNIAKKIVCPEHVRNIAVENGAVNFSLNPGFIVKQVLSSVHKQRSGYGYQPYPGDKERLNIIVEYSSPNIAKPFHAGHLRSTLTGNFLANLHESLGHNVTRINYLGDWGTQFGILCVGFQEFGSEADLAVDPIRHLYQTYVTVSAAAEKDTSIWESAKEAFKKMEEGDKEMLEMRQRFRELSIAEYAKTYKRLGIYFDEYSSEAQYSDETQTLLNKLRQQGLLHKSERGTEEMNLSDVCPRFPIATLAKSDGSSLYLSRDLVAARDRWDRYGFDRMYYVVDKGQESHFEQLKGVLRKMGGAFSGGIHHVKFGKVLGMQTRKGTAVFLDDILDEAKGRMLHNMEVSSTTKEQEDPERTAEILGVSAIILQDLKVSLLTDYEFNWDRILQSQGDTGVFLQYTHARLYSIERMNNWHECSLPLELDFNHLLEPEAVRLAWHVGHYDLAVRRAADENEPKAVAQYLITLCHLISRASKKLRVKGSPADVQEARLCLFSSARTTLANGMRLLGMEPLKKM